MKKLIFTVILFVGFVACKAQNSTEQPQTVDIHGEKLHYIQNGSGEPLIFIHGTVGDYRVWIPRVTSFSKAYDVITYSRRYAYPNTKVFDETADYSVRIHADDLYALIEELGFEKVNLVGHSYGAYTALTMALDHPDVVKSLVLGEPPAASLLENSPEGKVSFNKFSDDNLGAARNAFRSNNNEEGVESFLKGVMGDDFSISQVPDEVKQRWMDNLPEVWGVSLTEWLLPLEVSKIKGLDVPVLLLMGDQSPVWFGEVIKELHRLLPQSELVTIENSSHGLYFENPEAVDKAVMDFLKQNQNK